jgi:hypothetical protein
LLGASDLTVKTKNKETRRKIGRVGRDPPLGGTDLIWRSIAVPGEGCPVPRLTRGRLEGEVFGQATSPPRTVVRVY